MIAELSIALALTLPDAGPPVTRIQFVEPITEVVTYPPLGVLDQLSGLDLPAGTLAAFEDEFLDGSVYFGAFAITKEFGYGYVTGANSIEAAREIALQECLKQGPRCLIYAEILPQGYVPLEPGQVSLATEAADYYRNPRPDWGNFRAMAISEDGAYSVVWNYGTLSLAQDAALSDCAGYAIDDLPELRDMPCMLIPFK